MPFIHTRTDHTPLCFETEMIINDLGKLAEQVGFLLLGKHSHVASILAAKHRKPTASTNVMINRAQRQVSATTKEDQYRRDGWLFQMMTWISIRQEQSGIEIISQAPHDNPAQHGIDGLAIILTNDKRIKTMIIAEDKYTENPRDTIRLQVWPEFELFEKGEFDSQLVSRTSVLLAGLTFDELDVIINEDIYKPSKRTYRAGITPLAANNSPKKRKKLFKGYDGCVTGTDHLRRQALTFSQPDIRKWMDDFAGEIHNFLETQRP